jgi:CysZ protein
MFSAFGKAIAQLNDRAIQKPLSLSIAAAIVVFVMVWSVTGYLLTSTAFFTWGWLETVIDLLGGLATLILTWFLFPGIVSAVVAFFLDDVACAVEARHFPMLAVADGQTLGETIVGSLKFLALLIVLNLLMLPFLILGPVFPFVFYAVNGYLLGREYFELVALRRIDYASAKSLRKQRQGALFFAGVGIAFMLTIPVINLLTPIIATAAMVHLFENWRVDTNEVVAA